MVKDITVGSRGSSPRIVGYNNTSLFFSVLDFSNQDNTLRLWVTDGTPAGTLMLKDGRTDEPATAVSSNSTNQLNVLGSRVFFINEDGELWRSTGTTAETLFVHDLDGYTDIRPSFLGRFNNELYFSTSNNGSHKIYKSNGSGGGTVQINDFQVGSGATPILEHDHMFLVGRNNIGTFLYATDGTGPFEIVETLGQDGIFQADAAVHNGQVNKFVNYSNSTDGYQFYKITSGCPTLLTLTQNLSTSSDYYAQSIVSSSTINNNASILFSANMGTDLIDGFTVENLAQLEVLINGCP